MSLSSLLHWDVRSTGNDGNGGAFHQGASGTDYSQQDTAQIAFDGSTIKATTSGASATITLVGVSGAAAHVGNVIQITGGTNFLTGFYEVISRSGNTLTLDRTCTSASGSGMTGALGGALATPAKALGAMVTGNVVWLKKGTYSTSALLVMKSNSGSSPGIAFSLFSGYKTTHGDNPAWADCPTIQCTGAGVDGFQLDTSCFLAYVILDGTSTARDGVISNGYQQDSCASHVKITGFTRYGGNAAMQYNQVWVDSISGTYGGFYSTGYFVDCLVTNCYRGWYNQTNNTQGGMIRCIAAGNTNEGFILGPLYNMFLEGCIAYNNGSHGFCTYTANALFYIKNCIAVGNGGYGIHITDTGATMPLSSIDFNAFYNNTSGSYNGCVAGVHDVALTGDPFTNGAAGDFSLNAVAGAGAALKVAGFPGLWTNEVFTGYRDIGTVQHQDAGGATTNVFIQRGLARR